MDVQDRLRAVREARCRAARSDVVTFHELLWSEWDPLLDEMQKILTRTENLAVDLSGEPFSIYPALVFRFIRSWQIWRVLSRPRIRGSLWVARAYDPCSSLAAKMREPVVSQVFPNTHRVRKYEEQQIFLAKTPRHGPAARRASFTFVDWGSAIPDSAYALSDICVFNDESDQTLAWLDGEVFPRLSNKAKSTRRVVVFSWAGGTIAGQLRGMRRWSYLKGEVP